MAAMRDLLVHHVDDLDDIMDKLQHGTCEWPNNCCSVLLGDVVWGKHNGVKAWAQRGGCLDIQG